MSYPERLEIIPLSKPLAATIRVPGSKSITNRALVLAALSTRSQLRGALQSEDTEVMVEALRALGFDVQTDWANGIVSVCRRTDKSRIAASEADLFVGNSGTSMRFLTALVCLGQGRYRLDGVTRMRERPIEPLLSALRYLGAKAYSERGDGYPPVIVEADGLRGGVVHITGGVSSQYLSGLLMVAPFSREPMTILVDSLVSRPYVAMTVEMMRQFGCPVETDGSNWFQVPRQNWYAARDYDIEPDASAASYFLAGAAITQGEVTIPNLGLYGLQGDVQFVNVLFEMGCDTGQSGNESLHVRGGPLRGIDVDMNAISDTVMTLAAVACFADGPTTIRNVAHIRHKETDRLTALAAELRKVGAEVDEFPDGLRITPRPLHGAEIETYNDHRMAMSMALIGLRVPGIIIKNPGCVAKTYPRFWEDLERLRS